jgi:phosphatidate cytidylyltransferase
MNMSNLAKRLSFAAWAVPLGWLVINAPGYTLPAVITARFLHIPGITVFPGHAVAILLIFLGTSEYLNMLAIRFPRNGFWLMYVWIGLQLASYFIPEISLNARIDMFVLFILVAIEAFAWGKQSGRWRRASLLFSGTAFFSISGYALLAFYGESFQKMFPSRFFMWPLSQMGIVTVCAGIFFCDTAAYFYGSLFGKRHFSSVSPHKTIEGSIAGLAAAVLVSTLGWIFLISPAAREKYAFFQGDTFAIGTLMGIITGIFALAGDLVVSLMKRYFRVKDASNLIPGHGGILDRFDSVFFTTPVIQLFILIANRFVQ